jgi:predicted PurR-regulated permease PerM
MTDLLDFLTMLVLGVSAGSLVTEGAVLVPMWRAQRPEAFLAWYRQHAALLLKFFGPLEVAAALLAILSLGAHWVGRPGVPRLPALTAAFCVAVLVMFPLYFRRVNAAFESGAIAPDQVPGELARWARWHWLRTAIALGAFAAAVLTGMGRAGSGA